MLLTLILALTLVLVAGFWVYRDFKAWTSLGPGGLPHTAKGWLRMTMWRMKMDNPFSMSRFDFDNSPAAVLVGLPVRQGKRPRIAPHPVPHRQTEQKIPDELRDRHKTVFDHCVAKHEDIVEYKMSYFEKHNPAVTLRHVCGCHSDSSASRGEIAHIHPSDGSMHMILSPADAKIVIERGWGERHGLAGISLGLPATYMMIYAPRDEAELHVVGQLLEAAVSYMGTTKHHT